MSHSFDWFGFLSDEPIDGRSTDVAPPPSAEWPEGTRPNWTGYVWICLPYPPPVVRAIPPHTVTMRQARLALLQTGRLELVEAAIANAERAAQITWEYSQEVERDYPMVQQMAALLGWNDQDIDDLFTLAATL